MRGFSIGVLASAVLSFAASAQTLGPAESCRSAQTASVKVHSCTFELDKATDRRIRERLYLRRGNAYMELGRHAEALADFTNLLQLNPKIAGYFDNRMSAFRALGRFEEALHDANAAVLLGPTHSFVYRSRGLLFEVMGRFQAGITDFDRAIQIDPRDNALLVDRARMKVKAGRVQEGIIELSDVINREPAFLGAYKERGLGLLARGDLRRAEADLSLYLRTNPADAEARQALEAINARSVQPAPPIARFPQNVPNQTTPEAPKEAPGSQSSIGTGFFIASDGHLVTNAHVVANCAVAQIESGISAQGMARVVARDTANDLALLKTDVRPAAMAGLRSGVRTGEAIAAFGFPLYGLLASSGNFTLGNVSAVAGLGNDTRFLQISAPIQPGNSGGPVLDQNGNVVGVVVSKLNVLKVASTINDVPQNVNFAIKISVLTNFLESVGVVTSAGAASTPLSPADLADRAKAISVLIKCNN